MSRYVLPKTFLFVPATRPDRFAKAWASGADEVVLDWEDTVAPADKAAARQHTAAYGSAAGSRAVWVRVNAAGSPYHADDAAALAGQAYVKGVVLAKAERAADIAALHRQTGKPVIAAVETAAGMAAVADLARAPGVFALTYGCLDLAGSLGVRFGSRAAQAVFDRLRGDLLLHSRICGLHPPLETTLPEFKDEAAMAENMAYWRDFGFGGVLCIHPNQVAAARAVCQPSEAERAFATEVLAEAQRSGQAVFQVGGQMVDLPVIEWAKRVAAV
ncbi:HpcH/HpaI aldolase/citrate lyase family protein [Bergeriella denitrificans]|uniref:Citrate lyase subunit beta-like protein n=1 Tax=Bergeriella denitrificans TaxID=494 RepID=A0A378UFC9_BERDE|nr:CoA ester lyase [Bergeriella denitrificans]STZ75453.1 Citrate lyase subunit beta-like protein [Bergeriella denitrificans]